MGLFDIFKSRRNADDPASEVKLKNPAWDRVLKSRKKDDLAEAAFLHVLQRLDDAIPHLDEILGLQVLAAAFVEDGIEHTSKGFKLGLIKNRAFHGTFLAGAFNARHPDDINRFSLLFQAASGAAMQGLVDETGPNAVATTEIAPEIKRFMLATFKEGSSVLSTKEGLLATLNDEQHTFDLSPLRLVHNLYHEVYLTCFSPARYLAASEDGKSLRDKYQKEVQGNVRRCFKLMRDVCNEIDEIHKSG